MKQFIKRTYPIVSYYIILYYIYYKALVSTAARFRVFKFDLSQSRSHTTFGCNNIPSTLISQCARWTPSANDVSHKTLD